MKSLYEAIGPEGIQTLVKRFYELVFTNEAIAGLFQNDRVEIQEKQRKFLTQFLGGPALYTSEYGHPKMRRRHMPHAITNEAKDEWLKCMFQAIDETVPDESLKDQLKSAFPVLAQHMVNR